MFLQEAIKNSEAKKEKCGAAEWEVSQSLSWWFDPVVSGYHTVPAVHVFLQDPHPQRYTAIAELCFFLEKAEKKSDLQ